MIRNACFTIVFSALLAGCSCGSDKNQNNTGHDGGQDAGLDGGHDGGQDGGDGGYVPPTFPDGGLQQDFPPGDAGFVLGDGGSDSGTSGEGVGTDPNGHVVLNSQAVDLHYAWIANHAEGWVSKYDSTATMPDGGLKEVARYWSAIPFDGIDGGLLPGVLGSWTTAPLADGGLAVTAYSNFPSRTALDLNGDVWIANRAVGYAPGKSGNVDAGIQGSVTKVANRVEDCVDRNKDGIIETSQDLDGDGVIETNEMIMPTNPSDPNTYDECVLFSTEISDHACLPSCSSHYSDGGCKSYSCDSVKGRGLAVSAGFEGSPGVVWAVNYQDHEVDKLDGFSGAKVPALLDGGMAVKLPFGGYGAVVDSEQRLWVIQAPGDTRFPDGGGHSRIALIDTGTGQVVDSDISTPPEMGWANNYGVGIDGKSRVWVAGWNSGPYAFRYDRSSPPDGGWTKFDFSNLVSQVGTKMAWSRGIAVDENSRVFMSADKGLMPLADGGWKAFASAMLVSFNADDGGIYPFPLPDGGSTELLDETDTDSNTSIGVGLASDGKVWVNNYSGNAMRVDPATGVVAKTPKQSGAANLYTYSDFTGYQLRHYVAPSGSLYQVLSGCGPLSRWDHVTWDATLPPGTSINVYVRVSENKTDFSTATRYGPYPVSPADLQQTGTVNLGPVPMGSYLQVQFKLATSDRSKSPILNGFHVDWSCMATPN